jgi:hypothetical protein
MTTNVNQIDTVVVAHIAQRKSMYRGKGSRFHRSAYEYSKNRITNTPKRQSNKIQPVEKRNSINSKAKPAVLLRGLKRLVIV